jgi:hypothetical protein
MNKHLGASFDEFVAEGYVMESKHLEELLIMATKYGVKKLKTPEFEIELGPSAPLPQVVPATHEISEQDMLFWSSENSVEKEPS